MDAFPREIQLQLIRPVVEFLGEHDARLSVAAAVPANEGAPAATVFEAFSVIQLTCDAHVRWVMELLAKGLALQMTEDKTVRSCVEIYSSWLKLGPATPAPVRENPVRFIPTFLQHLSLVFEDISFRGPFPFHDEREMERGLVSQVDICSR